MTSATGQTCRHTPCPTGLTTWRLWAKKKAWTHQQQRCPVCGLWKVWVRKR